MKRGKPLYGLLAEFVDAHELIDAARQVRAAGYRRIDAFTPFPVEELEDALALPPSRLPWLVFTGGALGGLAGYCFQYWVSVIDYPLNIGGRPLHSWPAFIPVTFETTILGAALAAVLGMLALNGLPMPYHPLFNAPQFGLASRDRFFLCIEASDPQFDLENTKRFLADLHPRDVIEVKT